MPEPKFIHTKTHFCDVVKLDETPESLVLDFKQEFPTDSKSEKKREKHMEACRDIAAFANAIGGCLLFGVSEKKNCEGIKVAKDVIGVDNADGVRAKLEEVKSLYLVPSTLTADIEIVPLGDKKVVVCVNVPASRHLVAVVSQKKDKQHVIEYVRRTSYGKDWMNPDEAERHLMDGSRGAKLALIAATHEISGADTLEVQLAGRLWQRIGNTSQRAPENVELTLSKVGQETFHLKIDPPGTAVALPYGLIREAWVSAGTIQLLLNVKLFQDGSIEPY